MGWKKENRKDGNENCGYYARVIGTVNEKQNNMLNRVEENCPLYKNNPVYRRQDVYLI